MDQELDILQHYKTISNKLKKRFLKKPNVSEGSEQFGYLAKQLHYQNCPHYIGFCHLAQARCEHTLTNSVSEASALTTSARSFAAANDSLSQLHLPHFGEHLHAAINCFSHAIRVHLENRQCHLAASLNIELAQMLHTSARPVETIQHYQRAAELLLQNPLDYLLALMYIATAKILAGDYEGALARLTEMIYLLQDQLSLLSSASGQHVGVFADVTTSCELLRVFLLLLLQPTVQRIRPEHAQTLERYSWESSESTSGPLFYLHEDLFLLLQSVVLACQTGDIPALKRLEVDLSVHLSAEQSHLLHLIIATLDRPPSDMS